MASSQRVWRSSRARSSATSRCSVGERAAGARSRSPSRPTIATSGARRARRAGGRGPSARRGASRRPRPGARPRPGRRAVAKSCCSAQHARRVVEGGQRGRQLLAGPRRARHGAQRAVDELDAQRRGARQRGHRHRCVLDERGEVSRGQMRRRLVVARCARSPAGSARRPRPRGARRPRAGRRPARSGAARPGRDGAGEAVTALPRAQALARHAGQRGERVALTRSAHLCPPSSSLRNGGMSLP